MAVCRARGAYVCVAFVWQCVGNFCQNPGLFTMRERGNYQISDFGLDSLLAFLLVCVYVCVCVCVSLCVYSCVGLVLCVCASPFFCNNGRQLGSCALQ